MISGVLLGASLWAAARLRCHPRAAQWRSGGRQAVVLSALASALMACAPAAAPSHDEGRFRLSGFGRYQEASFDGERLSGPNLELQRFPDGLRGRLHNEVVSVRLSGDAVRGLAYGGAPIELHARQIEGSPHAWEATGLWAGRACRVRRSPEELEITFPLCGYTLTRQPAAGPGVFEGRALCERLRSDRVRLTLPPALEDRPAAERAFWMVAFLVAATGMP